MSDISQTSYWLKFFTEAGIPPSDATEYAIAFTDNRIKETMLVELNKEYLKDMGITVMGDIIAVLKHAKLVTSQLVRQKAFSSPQVNSSPSQSASSLLQTQDVTPPVKKSTAVTRMLEHYVRKEPPAPSTSPSPSAVVLSPSLSARLGGTKRPVEEEDSPPPNKRSSVFNRLGDNSVSSTTSDCPKITVTMLGKEKLKSNGETSSPAARRKSSDNIEKLSIPRRESSGKQLSIPRRESSGKSLSFPRRESSGIQLQYHGVLKYSTKELASQKLISEKPIPNTSLQIKLSKADTTSSIRNRLGASSKPISVSEGIFAHELDDISLKSKHKKPQIKSVVKQPFKVTIDRQSEGIFAHELDDISLKSKHKKPQIKSVVKQPLKVTIDRPSGSTSGSNVIKKIVKINKRTGHIVKEKSREIRSDVFNRLGK